MRKVAVIFNMVLLLSFSVTGQTPDDREVYGSGGIPGSPATGRMKQLNTFLADNDVEQIRDWLMSDTLAKQLYALMGYRYLMTMRSYSPTTEEKKRLASLRQQKDSLYVRGGCLMSKESYQTIVSYIDTCDRDKFLMTVNTKGSHYYEILMMKAFKVTYILAGMAIGLLLVGYFWGKPRTA